MFQRSGSSGIVEYSYYTAEVKPGAPDPLSVWREDHIF